jgi:hypothetical protein
MDSKAPDRRLGQIQQFIVARARNPIDTPLQQTLMFRLATQPPRWQEVQINDAPRANEIMVAVAVTDSGRPLPRVGGLAVAGVKGEDG